MAAERERKNYFCDIMSIYSMNNHNKEQEQETNYHQINFLVYISVFAQGQRADISSL